MGVLWIAQRTPFHRSASVTGRPAWLVKSPTAVQARLDVHDTANSSPLTAAGAAADLAVQPGAASA